jgi:hypothetical protein
MVSRELVELGQEAVVKVAREHAMGGRAVHLQLLASHFYEAIKDELERTPGHDRCRRDALAAATEQCRRAASCTTAPALIVVELRAAVAMLSGQPPCSVAARRASRPQLRVIQGGLA